MVNADIGESSFFVMIMFYGNDCNLSVFCFADKLSHGAHGTVDTPGAGLNSTIVTIPRMVEVSMTL